MHGQHSPGPHRQLTPQELADRAERVARRERRNQRRAPRKRTAARIERALHISLKVIVSGLVGLMGLVFMIVGCILLPPAISAAEGHGVHGVFIADQYVPAQPRRPSYWLGTFTASDHRLVVAHVGYNNPPRALHEGTELPALYPGGATVFAPHNSSAWFGDVVFTFIGAGFFGWWVWYMPLKPLRRRRRLRTQAAADPLGALLLTNKPTWPWARQRP